MRSLPISTRWSAVFLCSLLVIGTGWCGDEPLPDPSASLHPTDNVMALAKLRPLLAKSPDDQQLLGLALMCYANLCLTGEPETDGGDGPWLGYAGELLERRIAARRGAMPSSLDEEVPELWVRLVRGERIQVLAGLARWEKDPAISRNRALMILASTDWRSFRQTAPTTLHERYAGLRVGFETGVRQWMDAAETEHAQNPLTVCAMNWRGNRWGDPQTIIREAVAFSVWMLASQELDDATAKGLLLDLGAAIGAEVDPALERKDLWQRVTTACGRLRGPQIAPLTAAIRTCEQLLDRTHGLVAADGALNLYGLGDLAAWNRDRLYMSAFFSHLLQRQQTRDYQASDRVFGAALRAALPGSVISTRYTLGNQGTTYSENDRPAAAAWDALATAIGAEMDRARPHGISPLAVAINKLSIARPDLASPLLQRLVAAQPAGRLPRTNLERLVEAAGRCGQVPLVLPSLRHWAQQAPSDNYLHGLMRDWSPATTFVELAGRQPFRTWNDAVVDNRKLPWPNLELSQWFSIRWQGDLRIDQPGTYTLAVESDDGSRLAVGEVVVDNGGNHAMQVRRMEATFSAGWFPLRLEFLQGSGEAGCRLLWQPPGGAALVPIPAANLAHGPDHAPGLVAEGFDHAQIGSRKLPNDDDIAYAHSMPWHLAALEYVGQRWFEARRYHEAAEYFRLITTLPANAYYDMRLHQCLLWAEPPDIDGALAIIRRSPQLHTRGFELCRTTEAFRGQGRLAELITAIGTSQDGGEIWPFTLGYAALERGDLRAAHDHFATLMGEGGPGDRYLPNNFLNLARLECAVFARLDGKEPDWAAVEAGLRRNGGQPWQDLVLDWLSGAVSWEDCVTRVPTTEDGEDLYYFQGLVALTTGDHTTAKQRFQEVVTKHSNWMEAPTCRALLKWYETQTPDTLAKVATAKPIGKPAAQPSKPRPDANDF